jgi:uncharacterized protein YjiS (DUF1127 family)
MTMITHPARDGFFGGDRRTTPARSAWALVGGAVVALVTALLDWQERARQRRQLLALGDRALQDFGRSRADAAGEGRKPFWRA